MNHNLYFIPIIQRALGNKINKREALENAFRMIESLGRLDDYKTGCRQFSRFMGEIGFSKRSYSYHELERKMSECFERPGHLDITVEKNGKPMRTCRFAFAGGINSFDGITPGSYRLILDTGLCLWSCRLRETDLLLSKGSGDTLEMAADTNGTAARPAMRESFFGGMIRLSLYAGFTGGSMQITVENTGISE